MIVGVKCSPFSLARLTVHDAHHTHREEGRCDAKGGKAGVVHHPMRFLHGCGQRWWIVGRRLSVCVRVYQHLSCLLLRCAGCLLTALPRLPHIIQLSANLERKQKPTHC